MNNLVPLLRLFKRLGPAFSAQWRSNPTPALDFRPGLSVVLVLLALLVPLGVSLQGKHQAHATASLSIDAYVCGTAVNIPNENQTGGGNNWQQVSKVVDQSHNVFDSEDGITVLAIGFQGDGNTNATCSGDYSFGWTQNYQHAQWTYNDPNSATKGDYCEVQVFNPPWFFGASAAKYSLEIDSGPTSSPTSTQSVQFLPLDQNNALNNVTLSQNDSTDPGHDAARWVTLIPTSPVSYYFNTFFPLNVTRATTGSADEQAYRFTLDLREGGVQRRYLGADAAHFMCKTVA